MLPKLYVVYDDEDFLIKVRGLVEYVYDVVCYKVSDVDADFDVGYGEYLFFAVLNNKCRRDLIIECLYVDKLINITGDVDVGYARNVFIDVDVDFVRCKCGDGCFFFSGCAVRKCVFGVCCLVDFDSVLYRCSLGFCCRVFNGCKLSYVSSISDTLFLNNQKVSQKKYRYSGIIIDKLRYQLSFSRLMELLDFRYVDDFVMRLEYYKFNVVSDGDSYVVSDSSSLVCSPLVVNRLGEHVLSNVDLRDYLKVDVVNITSLGVYFTAYLDNFVDGVVDVYADGVKVCPYSFFVHDLFDGIHTRDEVSYFVPASLGGTIQFEFLNDVVEIYLFSFDEVGSLIVDFKNVTSVFNLKVFKNYLSSSYFDGRICRNYIFKDSKYNRVLLCDFVSMIVETKSRGFKFRRYLSAVYRYYVVFWFRLYGIRSRLIAWMRDVDIFELISGEFNDVVDNMSLLFDVDLSYRLFALNEVFIKSRLLDNIFVGKVKSEMSLVDYDGIPFIDTDKKCLVIDNLRKEFYKDCYIDISSQSFINGLAGDVLTLEYPNNLGEHFNEVSSSRRYLDGLDRYYSYKNISFYKRRVNRHFRSSLSQKLFCPVKSYIYEVFVSKYMVYNYSYNYYYALLSKLRPDEVVVVGPYRRYIYEAATGLGIKKKELQYAAYTSGHQGFKYRDVLTSPDELLVYNDYWFDNYSGLGLEVKSYNNIIYNEQIGMIKGGQKILFASQGTIGRKLAEYCYEMACQFPLYNFVYRLHPHEKVDSYLIYQKLSSCANIDITSSSDSTVWEDLGQSCAVIGCYSSLLYTSVEIGLPTIVVKLSGYSTVKNLWSSGRASLVQSYKSLSYQISKLEVL